MNFHPLLRLYNTWVIKFRPCGLRKNNFRQFFPQIFLTANQNHLGFLVLLLPMKNLFWDIALTARNLFQPISFNYLHVFYIFLCQQQPSTSAVALLWCLPMQYVYENLSPSPNPNKTFFQSSLRIQIILFPLISLLCTYLQLGVGFFQYG